MAELDAIRRQPSSIQVEDTKEIKVLRKDNVAMAKEIKKLQK